MQYNQQYSQPISKMEMEDSASRVSSTTQDEESKPMRRKGSTIMNKHPRQVQRRNERERKRVSTVNDWFVTLRNVIPLGGKQKKLSKVETLRQAARYINQMKQMLDTTGADSTSSSSSFCVRSESGSTGQYSTCTSPLDDSDLLQEDIQLQEQLQGDSMYSAVSALSPSFCANDFVPVSNAVHPAHPAHPVASGMPPLAMCPYPAPPNLQMHPQYANGQMVCHQSMPVCTQSTFQCENTFQNVQFVNDQNKMFPYQSQFRA